ncbi:MAG TPA: EamA family transporter [Candidatus Wirthbacteria bacterium]|nr:EamA family transporter [Candidatus Wirthbacteria bacterium]
MKQSTKWNLLVLLSMIIMSTLPAATKILNQSFIPLAIVFWKYVIANAILFTFLKWQKIPLAVNRPAWSNLLLLGCFSTDPGLAMAYSARFTTAANVSILINAQPPFILLYNVLFTRHKTSFVQIMAVFVALFGVVVINLDHGFTWQQLIASQYLLGNLISLLGAFLFASYTLINAKLINQINGLVLNFYSFLCAILLCLPPLLLTKDRSGLTSSCNWQGWLLMLYVGTIPSVLVFQI